MYVHIRRQMTCKYGCVLLLCREIGVETVREGGREGGRVKGEGRCLPLNMYVSLKFLNFVETVENN